MATPKKKHLIELMIEAGVKWPDGAEYAAQDKRDLYVWFYTAMPRREGVDKWTSDTIPRGRCDVVDGKALPSLCRNWHQTIVTREQYVEELAAMMPGVQREAQPGPKYCASVMRQMPDNTIEQLTAYYHAKAAESDRLQSVADEALKAADDALIALENAGELIGLVISIDTKPKQEAKPEITDCRDLRVGDVIEYVQGTVDSRIGMQGVVEEIDFDDADFPIRVMIDGELWWCNAFRFIRRP